MQSAEHLSRRSVLLGAGMIPLLAACNVSSNEQISPGTSSPSVARVEPTARIQPTPSLAPVKQERISPTDPVGKKRYAVRFVEALSNGDMKEIAGFFYRSTWETDTGLQNNVRALATQIKGCVSSSDDVVIRQQDGRELVTVAFKNPCSEVFNDKVKRLMLAHSIQFSLDLSVDEVRIGSTPFELIPSVVPVPTATPRPTEVPPTPTIVPNPNKLFTLETTLWRKQPVDMYDNTVKDSNRTRMTGLILFPPELFINYLQPNSQEDPSFLLSETVRDPATLRQPIFATLFAGQAWLLVAVTPRGQNDTLAQHVGLVLSVITQALENLDARSESRVSEKGQSLVRLEAGSLETFSMIGLQGLSQTHQIYHLMFDNPKLYSVPIRGIWVTSFASFLPWGKKVYIVFGSNLDRQEHVGSMFRQVLQQTSLKFTRY